MSAMPSDHQAFTYREVAPSRGSDPKLVVEARVALEPVSLAEFASSCSGPHAAAVV